MYTSKNLSMNLKTRGRLIGRVIGSLTLIAALCVSVSLIAKAQSGTPSTQLTLTISSQGMTPTTATVYSWIIHVRVINHSNLESLKLKVLRQSGELVREPTAPNKAEIWDLELELGTGQFVISEASNTSWACQITAQAPPSNAGQAGALHLP
jgi:hypothetical protein